MEDSKIANQTFSNQDVLLQEIVYENCTFVNCNLIFTGKLPTFTACNFDEANFTFADQALNTIEFLTGLYASGAGQMIEGIFEHIRSGGPKTNIIH